MHVSLFPQGVGLVAVAALTALLVVMRKKNAQAAAPARGSARASRSRI